MTLGGSLARLRVAEFASLGMWTPTIVDIDEVEANDPRAGVKDDRRLLDQGVIDDRFQFRRSNGVSCVGV